MPENVTVGNPFIIKQRHHYYVKITIRNPETGTVRILKKTTNVPAKGANGLSKAHQVRLDILAEYQNHHDPLAPIKLKDFADHYIIERETENLTRSSLRGIRKAFDDLLAYTGEKKLLKQVVVSDLREFLFKYLKSPAMALCNYRYLHAAFDRAVRDEKLPMNPFNQIDTKLLRKRFKPRPRGIISAGDVVRIYDNLPKDRFCDRTFANYFLLLYGTAFRRGEGCYLETQHVDFKEKIISVRSTEEHKLKTEASASDIPMTDHARIAIRDQMKSKAENKNWQVQESRYIFCNLKGTHYYPDTMTKQVLARVRAVCKKLKIDFTGGDLHSLRHALIQHLIDSGSEPIVVSKFARHANLAITLSAYHKMSDTKTKFESVLNVTKEMPRPKQGK